MKRREFKRPTPSLQLTPPAAGVGGNLLRRRRVFTPPPTKREEQQPLKEPTLKYTPMYLPETHGRKVKRKGWQCCRAEEGFYPDGEIDWYWACLNPYMFNPQYISCRPDYCKYTERCKKLKVEVYED